MTKKQPNRSEAFDWLFQRVSGVILALILGVHFILLHFISGGEYEYTAIVTRMTSTGWRIFYILFVLLAIYHLGTGIKIIIDDYVHRQGLRLYFLSLNYLLAAVLFIFCVYTLMGIG